MLAASFRAVESHQAGDRAGECLGSGSIDGQVRAVRVQPARILVGLCSTQGTAQHPVRVTGGVGYLDESDQLHHD